MKCEIILSILFINLISEYIFYLVKKNKDKKRKTKKSSRNEVDIVNIQSQNIDNTRREINDDKLNTSMMGDDSITAGRRINDLITSSNQKGNASPEVKS